MNQPATILLYGITLMATACAALLLLLLFHRLRERHLQPWQRGNAEKAAAARTDWQPAGSQFLLRFQAVFGQGVPALLDRLGNAYIPGMAVPLADTVERQLARAGLQGVLTPRRWRGLRLLSAAVTGCFTGALGLLATGTLSSTGVSALAGALLGWQLTGHWLQHRIKGRQARMKSSLPMVVDFLQLGLAGGLNVRQALALTIAATEGELVGVLRQVDSALALGTPLSQAVAAALVQVEPGPVHLVLEGLVDAETLGSQYSDALQEQSRFVQALERQETDQQLNSLPLKLMVASLVFFMPSIFVITLVPNLLAMLRSGW